jgi:hypothetical protein
MQDWADHLDQKLTEEPAASMRPADQIAVTV